MLSAQELAGLWRPERSYLNTASYGLPPLPACEALQAALDKWRGWVEDLASSMPLVGA